MTVPNTNDPNTDPRTEAVPSETAAAGSRSGAGAGSAASRAGASASAGSGAGSGEQVWSEQPTPVSPDDLSEGTWSLLRAEATTAMEKGYAPYSGFPVGAAGLVDDGRIVGGCNIENASFGVTLCAECSLVSDLLMSGGGRLVAFDCVDGHGNTLVPCGRCRQLLFEHGGNDLILNMPSGRAPLSVVLPEAFGPDHLGARAEHEHAARH